MTMQRMYHGRWRDREGNVVRHLATSEIEQAREWRSHYYPESGPVAITQNWVATVASPEEPAVL